MSICLYYTSGVRTCSMGRARLQFYWPLIKLTKMELHVDAPVVLRLMWNSRDGYYGFGFQILGFGLGGDFDKHSPVTRTPPHG